MPTLTAVPESAPILFDRTDLTPRPPPPLLPLPVEVREERPRPPRQGNGFFGGAGGTAPDPNAECIVTFYDAIENFGTGTRTVKKSQSSNCPWLNT